MIKGINDPTRLGGLMPAFAAIAPELNPKELHLLTRWIVEAIKSATSGYQLIPLQPVFDDLSRQLKLEVARALSVPIANEIMSTNDRNQRFMLSVVFATLAAELKPQLKPEEALRSAVGIVEAVNGTTTENRGELTTLGKALAAIVPQLKPEDAQAFASQVVVAVARDPNRLSALGPALLSIAPQLKPEEALALADRTLEAMKGTTDRDQHRALEQVLESIASHSKPEEVQALASQVVVAVARARSRSTKRSGTGIAVNRASTEARGGAGSR